ncbi:VOC family protein [Oerskovia flava]|uniref:VOC family protein n=1 Tax=Oerskovia flava TaxID=2986422 RepID=UPI00224021CC|nr:VOC family protein [Oerskovia sp. JB1-3-2]
MALSFDMITVDATDPRPLAEWWARHLGGRVVAEPDGSFVQIVPAEGSTTPGLSFQRVTRPTPGKNRLHLDLVTSDRERDVAALLADGAVLVTERSAPGFRWAVLEDPQGNVFCVGAPESGPTEVPTGEARPAP